MEIKNDQDHASAVKSRYNFAICVRDNKRRLKEDIKEEEKIKLEEENEMYEEKIKEFSTAIHQFIDNDRPAEVKPLHEITLHRSIKLPPRNRFPIPKKNPFSKLIGRHIMSLTEEEIEHCESDEEEEEEKEEKETEKGSISFNDDDNNKIAIGPPIKLPVVLQYQPLPEGVHIDTLVFANSIDKLNKSK